MKKLIIASAIAAVPTMAFADISHYGFIKGSFLKADQALDSDHKAFAANDETGATGFDKKGRTQFSFTQSRWGIKASHDKISGKFEFDLDGDSNNENGDVKSSTGIIRVRQANMSYKIGQNGKLTFGKKWTKFMGILPHTYSFTKVNFFAGNTGFLVDGADYTHTMGDLSFAIEMSNLGEGDVAKASSPVMTANVDYKNDMFRAGFAYTKASLAHKEVLATAGDVDSDAMGMKVYGSFTGVKNLNVGAEYYTGENLGSIQTGALASALAADAKKRKETGYFVTAKYMLGDYSVFGGYGTSEMDKATEATVAKKTANTLTHFGLDAKLEKNLTAFFQYEGFDTTWRTTSTTTNSTKASSMEVGLVYKF